MLIRSGISNPCIKEAADVEKLSQFRIGSRSRIWSSTFRAAERLGERGTPVCFVTSPMVMISHLMHFQTFFEWIAMERPLIDRLLDTIYERVAERLQYVLEHGVGPVFRFGGSEQATPPMMSKRMFDQFILQYERPLWQMVRKAGKTVWVHCHGKVNTVIDDFVEGGVQMLDPVEPPPQGDIEIDEAKRRAAAGSDDADRQYSIQRFMSALHAGNRSIWLSRRSVKAAASISFWGRPNFRFPPLMNAFRDNLLCYIEAGVKYGTF